MVIDIKKYFQSDGLGDKVSCQLDFSGVELGGVKPFCAPVKVEAALKGFASAVDFQARVEFSLLMPCDRCAEEFTREYEKTFRHMLVRETQGEEDEDTILTPEEKLDLDRLVLEDVLLNMPGQFLCKEDCKGLCPTCGTNWNHGMCGCGGPVIDPRLEVLKELL